MVARLHFNNSDAPVRNRPPAYNPQITGKVPVDHNRSIMLSMMAAMDEEDLPYECPVCFELVDHTWRMLSCKHTFCSDCLEKVYKLNENPQCPTCREVIVVSIEQLQPPQFLFNSYDEYKRRQDDRIQTENDVLSSAIEQSISQYQIDQDLDHQEEKYWHTALRLSADQTVPDAENAGSCSGDAEFVGIASGRNISNLTGEGASSEVVILPLVLNASDPQPIHHEESHIRFDLNIPNLNKYLRVDHQNFVLDELMSDVTDDEKLNSLEKSRISEYLEIINDHLIALKSYRRDRKIEIIDESGEDRATMERILELDDSDDHRGDENAVDGDDDIELAEQLSHQMHLGLDGDALLNIMLKKSEILDSIDSLRMHFSDIKEKLEFRKAIIESESEYLLN